MDTINMLSGEDLVMKGVTRLEVNLPELGIKDVVPNGSWLEQKQIQSALEAKKHLIQVERIEKKGSLSQAVWNEDLNLAEVLHKVGGYWQFLGHNVGRILYLNPEEALFLMEISSLQLNFGGVKVSLQQAYTLLLKGDMTLLKYKVYVSLSRVGYKVFRHKKLAISDNDISSNKGNERNGDTSDALPVKLESVCEIMQINNSSDNLNKEELKSTSLSQVQDTTAIAVAETSSNYERESEEKVLYNNNIESYETVYKSYHKKIIKLQNRKIKLSMNKHSNDSFSNIPDLIDKRIITIKVPEAKYVPANLNLKETYTINLNNIPKKCARTSSQTYSSSDEANGNHIKRLRTESNCTDNYNYNVRQNRRNTEHFEYRPEFYARHHNLHYYNINMLFQNTLHQVYFPSLFQTFGPQVYHRPIYNNVQSACHSGNRLPNHSNERNQDMFLHRIKVMASKLKTLVSRGNRNFDNIRSLRFLISRYNLRYKTNIRLSPTLEIISGRENIVETIELDIDDEEPQAKRHKLNDSLEDNLNAVKKTALELKAMEMEGNATARHRRSLSKLLKTFNNCYNVDYYFNADYEVINRRHITLDSSSDTDCAGEKPIEHGVLKQKKGKKLRNPFNILKRLSEKQDDISCSSEESFIAEAIDETRNACVKDTVTENWLPNAGDFAQIEVPKKNISDPLFDMKKSNLLYDFMKFKPQSYNSWCESKIAFLKSLKESITEFHHEISTFERNYDKDCLVTPADCVNMETVLQKLRIIKTNTDISNESTLNIDFDVYNRDVENFRKKNPPKPHFRVVCLDESSMLPSISELEALRSQCDDDIPLVFALVSVSSISYLQIKPMETPLYKPTNTF